MHRSASRPEHAGHIDNSVVFLIVPILVMIGGSVLYREVTGRSPFTLWQNLPDDVRHLSVRVPLLLIGTLAASAVASVTGGHGVRVEADPGRVRIRLTEPGLRVFGVGLLLLALYLGWAGWAAQGLFRWLLLALAVVFAVGGLPVAGADTRIVVTSSKVTIERRLFGAVTGTDEHTIDVGPDAAVTLEEGRSGGAFGRPLRFHHTVAIDSIAIHSDGSRARAEAVRDALSEAAVLLGPVGRDGER